MIGLQVAGLGADLVRGIVLTAVGLVVFAPLQTLLLQTWGSSAPLSRAVVVGAAGAVSLGAVYKLFHAIPGFAWQFLVGLAAGLAAVVLAMTPRPRVPELRRCRSATRVAMFFRLLAVQGAWNYETLVGNGIGFCVEPALRRLPGGPGRRRLSRGAGAREPVLQRAPVPDQRGGRRPGARRARWRGAGAHRAVPHRAVRPTRCVRRPAGVGDLPSALLVHGARRVRAWRLAAGDRRWCSSGCTTPGTSGCASGACRSAGAAGWASPSR